MRFWNIWRSIIKSTPEEQSPSGYADAKSASAAGPYPGGTSSGTRAGEPRINANSHSHLTKWFWKRFEAWRADRELFLLDLAYLTVLPPVLLLVKLPMLLFLFIAAALLLFGKKGTKPALFWVALTGLFAIFFSLYGAFNMAGLSRLKLFVELILYLLLLAVTLQRLTRSLNFYLLISPALLLALSLFFFDSLAMLAGIVTELFLLLWLILAYRMRSGAAASLRMAGMLFALALPWVMLLFLFFPRISFEHASYGFRADEIRRTGHDGSMRMDAAALLVPSERIVMEVGFPGRVPDETKLYFRGSVLYVDKKDHWEPLPRGVPRRYLPRQSARQGMYDAIDGIIAYKVSLYPTRKNWLYLLDLPFEAPKGAKINADFETTLEKPVDEPLYYDAGSALVYRYGRHTSPAVLAAALDINADANPRTRRAAESIAAAYEAPQKRLAALLRFFRDRNLTYTLRPDPLDLNHTADSFLFDKRKGYCVHFDGAFVTTARLAGLPARVVTGYKADHANSVNNYLAVKERDAHAWAEVFTGGQWQRVETTATARFIDESSAQLLRQNGALNAGGEGLARLNLYLMYVKYQVETWILQYSHFRQMQLLDRLKKRPAFAAGFAAAFFGVAVLCLLLFLYLRRPRCRAPLLCILRPLLAKLRAQGFERAEGETLHGLFARYLNVYPHSVLAAVDRDYHRLRYGGSGEDLVQFKKNVRTFLREP